jgi:hypothetical protein
MIITVHILSTIMRGTVTCLLYFNPTLGECFHRPLAYRYKEVLPQPSSIKLASLYRIPDLWKKM